MTFQLSIRGGDEMKYRIVEKEEFNLVGFKKRVPMGKTISQISNYRYHTQSIK